MKKTRFSYQFVVAYAWALGQRVNRLLWLGNRKNYYYEYYLNGKRYKSLKDIVNKLDEMREIL